MGEKRLFQNWAGQISLLCESESRLLRPVELTHLPLRTSRGGPGGLDRKESACNAGNADIVPESGRSPGGGCGNPLQYSRLGNPMGNPMDRGAWWASVRVVEKSWT